MIASMACPAQQCRGAADAQRIPPISLERRAKLASPHTSSMAGILNNSGSQALLAIATLSSIPRTSRWSDSLSKRCLTGGLPDILAQRDLVAS